MGYLKDYNKQPVSIKGPLPESAQIMFRRLFSVDKTIAIEAGRLPAFQKDIKEKDLLSLARFTELIENATTEQKFNLASLLNIGLKEFRSYSSPLEAIFWALKKDDYNRNKMILQLPLEELLDRA